MQLSDWSNKNTWTRGGNGLGKMADAGGIVGKADIRSAMFNPGGWKSLLTFIILALAWLAGFSSRLFAVIRFESIIHEFDPW